ncbi:MAG: hypothetical protein GY820_09305 [Gammaproteobacteria bacterium]|nr:hypothetical protein [Gammaproteobacteria bacterium]
MFSPGANVLYDITVNGSSSFTATVDVYEDGLNAQTVNIAGGVIDGFQITGTLYGGTGFGTGSFDILFDVDNNEGASLGRIEATGASRWSGNLYGIDVDDGKFSSDSVGTYTGGDLNIERCVFPNSAATLVIPDNNYNIYQLAHPVENQGIGTCAVTYESTGHTGFASVVNDTGIDDKLVFAFTNGEVALFSIMYK